MSRIPYLIVGAGPVGLQMAHFLDAAAWRASIELNTPDADCQFVIQA